MVVRDCADNPRPGGVVLHSAILGTVRPLVRGIECPTLAIASKKRNSVAKYDVQAMADSCAASSPESRRSTTDASRVRAEVEASSTNSTAVGASIVVLWGSARAEVPVDAIINGVHFIDGRQLLDWITGQNGHEVPLKLPGTL